MSGHSSRPLTVPTVHIGGTSFDGLMIPLHDAAHAVREAITALRECDPHGRDYYLQGEKAINIAISEHLSRTSRLQSVLEELQSLMEAVHKQTPDRRPVSGPAPSVDPDEDSDLCTDDLGRDGVLRRAEKTNRLCPECSSDDCMARTFEPDDKSADREQCWCPNGHSWWVEGREPA